MRSRIDGTPWVGVWEMIRKLNLGCGYDRREGFLNADNFAACDPDIHLDIETAPWPLADNGFDYVLMKHVLEHVGASFEGFAQIMRELHRITAPDGIIEIQVPHFRHDTWWSDPTHVRGFTPLTFRMMSKRQNDEWIAQRANYTMLAYRMGVDFELVEATMVYDPVWIQRERAGDVSREQLRILAETQWGVAKELHVKMRPVKVC